MTVVPKAMEKKERTHIPFVLLGCAPMRPTVIVSLSLGKATWRVAVCVAVDLIMQEHPVNNALGVTTAGHGVKPFRSQCQEPR